MDQVPLSVAIVASLILTVLWAAVLASAFVLGLREKMALLVPAILAVLVVASQVLTVLFWAPVRELWILNIPAIFWAATVISVFVLEFRTAVIFAGMWVAGWFALGFFPFGSYVLIVYSALLALTLITMMKDGK